MAMSKTLFRELPPVLTENHIYGFGWIRWTVHDAGAASVNRAIRALAQADFAVMVTPRYHYPALSRELEHEHLESQYRLSNAMKRKAAGEWADGS